MGQGTFLAEAEASFHVSVGGLDGPDSPLVAIPQCTPFFHNFAQIHFSELSQCPNILRTIFFELPVPKQGKGVSLPPPPKKNVSPVVGAGGGGEEPTIAKKACIHMCAVFCEL